MIGNCDSLIYLGGNEYATFEWLSKYIGKMTERTKSPKHRARQPRFQQ